MYCSEVQLTIYVFMAHSSGLYLPTWTKKKKEEQKFIAIFPVTNPVIQIKRLYVVEQRETSVFSFGTPKSYTS